MEQAVLYVRLNRANKDWLAARARDAGLSSAAALDAILAEARARDWTLRPNPAQVIQP